MKRILMLVPIMLLASLALSQTDSLAKNNLVRVGEDLLAKDNSILGEMRVATIHEFEVMVADSVITKSEMVRLEDRINEFDEMTQHLSKRLQIYNLSTSVLLDPVYHTMVNVYFDSVNSSGTMFYGDDKKETIRRLAVGLVGHDVNINTGIRKDSFSSIYIFCIIIPLIFGLLVCWFLSKATAVNDNTRTWVGIIFGLGVLAFFLFIFP